MNYKCFCSTRGGRGRNKLQPWNWREQERRLKGWMKFFFLNKEREMKKETLQVKAQDVQES
jgi:hypothetical protein